MHIPYKYLLIWDNEVAAKEVSGVAEAPAYNACNDEDRNDEDLRIAVIHSIARRVQDRQEHTKEYIAEGRRTQTYSEVYPVRSN